jgi:hypothetical protein
MVENPLPGRREFEPHMIGLADEATASDEACAATSQQQKQGFTLRTAAWILVASVSASALGLFLLSLVVDFVEERLQCGSDGCAVASAPSPPPHVCAERVASGVQHCSQHPWCTNMVESTLISFAELSGALAAGANGSAVAPRLFLALDYRYFAACHLPASENLEALVLECDADAAQRAGGAAATSVAALGAAGGGAAGLGAYSLPYSSLSSAAAVGAAAVIYCANAA